MPWVRIDDELPDHPKFHALISLEGGDGGWYWLRANAWSTRHGMGGFIPETTVPHIYARLSPRRVKRIVKALVTVGLWDVAEGGYRVHDFDQYNPRPEEVAERRGAISAKRSESGRRGAAARWGAASDGDQAVAPPSEPVASAKPMAKLRFAIANGWQKHGKPIANAWQRDSNAMAPIPIPEEIKSENHRHHPLAQRASEPASGAESAQPRDDDDDDQDFIFDAEPDADSESDLGSQTGSQTAWQSGSQTDGKPVHGKPLDGAPPAPPSSPTPPLTPREQAALAALLALPALVAIIPNPPQCVRDLCAEAPEVDVPAQLGYAARWIGERPLEPIRNGRRFLLRCMRNAQDRLAADARASPRPDERPSGIYRTSKPATAPPSSPAGRSSPRPAALATPPLAPTEMRSLAESALSRLTPGAG